MPLAQNSATPPLISRQTGCPMYVVLYTALSKAAAGALSERRPKGVGATPIPARSSQHTLKSAVLRGSPKTSVLSLPCVPQYSCCAQPLMSPNPELIKAVKTLTASSALPNAPRAATWRPTE